MNCHLRPFFQALFIFKTDINYFGIVFISILFFCNNLHAAEPIIKISQQGLEMRNGASPYNCGEYFAGTLQPILENEKEKYLTLKITTENFLSPVKLFKVFYTNNGYKTSKLSDTKKFISYTTKLKTIKIPIYPIEDDIPYAINQVIVSATVGEKTISSTFNYRVFRPLYLKRSFDQNKDCMTMFPAEKITGPLTNSTDQPRTVQITDSLGKSVIVSRGRTHGWSIGLSLFNMINIGTNVSWVQSQTEIVNTNSSLTLQTIISPGARFFLTRQLTLVEDAYELYSVDECGKLTELGDIAYRHWLVTYPVAKIIPRSSEAPTGPNGGTPPSGDFDIEYEPQINTCQFDQDPSWNRNKIVLPEIPSSKNNLVGKVSDPYFFNQMGKILTNENLSEQERKSHFQKSFNQIFSLAP